MHKNAQQRIEVLGLLYTTRESDPRDGWVSEYDLKNALGNIRFALSVLVETGQIKRDGNKYQITGNGVLFFEEMQK